MAITISNGTQQRELSRRAQGKSVVHIHNSDLQEVTLVYPQLPEQRQIGSLFSSLDRLLTLHQRAYSKLAAIKKSLLQKMFPREGASAPEIRFKGFTHAWEQRRLGEVAQIKTGASDVQDAVSDGAYPFFVRSDTVERSNKYLFEGEAILIPGEGRLGDIYHYINGKFDYHQRVYKVSDFADDVDGKFILYTMQSTFKKHAMKHTVKATVDSLRLPMLTDYELKIPAVAEQIKIGQFFTALSALLTLHQRELAKLQNIKKALLSNMFV